MRFVSCVAALLCLMIPVGTVEVSAKSPQFMRVHGQALPPFGFVSFCQRYGGECRQAETRDFSRFNATARKLGELDDVNRRVNRAIKPVTDLALYGQEEYWTFPISQGDCEDYVVLKRRMLMQLGWPASALLITVVLDEQGDGHAVLTARTSQGDYILDNKVDDVMAWHRTPYKYLMRQSYLNPRLWMAIDPAAARGAGTVAGLNAADGTAGQ